MRPHLDRPAAQRRCGVAAIGVAQEFPAVFTPTAGIGFTALAPPAHRGQRATLGRYPASGSRVTEGQHGYT